MEGLAVDLNRDWVARLTDEVSRVGPWGPLERLLAVKPLAPADLKLRGYIEILRNAIVRELLSGTGGLEARPRLTNEFLSDYGRFDLNAQEGFLISLIDGRLTLHQLLRLSPFDAFTTLFSVAKLQRQKAIAT